MNEPLPSELSPDSTATPDQLTAGALASVETLRHGLDRTHDAILTMGSENEMLKRHLEEARAQISLMGAQVSLIGSELESMRAENQHLAAEARSAREESQQMAINFDRVRQENRRLVTEVEEARGEKQQLIAEAESVREENQRLAANCDGAAEHRKSLEAQLGREREDNRMLQEHIRELHFDLQAQDLPSLALKMAMRLTGAEVGLFTEADGDGALARVGFENLQEFISEAIFDYSRRTAQTEEPTVENESIKLPDGSGLVNLAALPFAVKGELRGVLLLANKRNGPFTDAECQILMAIGQHAGLAMENARLHRKVNEAYVSTVAVLADAIEAKDAYTRGHCEGVSRVAVEVARRLGLENEELDAVRYAALLHDVGKIGIPDGILLKPGKLMDEEFSIIQKHSLIGHDLVSRVPALSHLGDVILHHHERFDGSGYPEGLDGENIPLVSRIIGIVDAFDAMTTPRPYRDPVDHIEAYEEMRRCAGTQFDPRLVELVTQVLIETSNES
jgi:HD-GYP domain-containing protein (c-di-GMP phosphodiesterase class II)